MIQAILILSAIVAGLTVLNIIQLKKRWADKAMLRHQRHAIHAFEEMEGKIGELERYYENKKTELSSANNADDVANILNGMQNGLHRAKDHTPINPRRATG